MLSNNYDPLGLEAPFLLNGDWLIIQQLCRDKEYTLHHFPDISETGYGQTSYLRTINENGDVHSCLIVGKPWVAPVKHVTIP